LELFIGDEGDLAHAAARRFTAVLGATSLVPRIGLATGKSPRLTYEILRALHAEKEINLCSAVWVMLDEYIGLPPSHSRRFEEELRNTLFGGLPRDAVSLIVPPSNDPQDPETIGQFGQIVADEPVQLQVLGIGRNGHIGFNEPGSLFGSRTRIVSLSETTLQDMAHEAWSGVEMPTTAVTQGLADIMGAQEILLLAIGNAKFEALRRAFREPQSVECPASVLQTHPNLKVLVTPDLARAFR